MAEDSRRNAANERPESEDEAIEREIREIRASIEEAAADFPDFDDWYRDLRLQYGKPSDDVLAYLYDGDFAAFEQLMRDGYEPLLR